MKRGPKTGATWKRKGGYHLSSMGVGEAKTFRPDDHEKRSVRHLQAGINSSMRAVRGATFTCMSFTDHVWVRRLS